VEAISVSLVGGVKMRVSIGVATELLNYYGHGTIVSKNVGLGVPS